MDRSLIMALAIVTVSLVTIAIRIALSPSPVQETINKIASCAAMNRQLNQAIAEAQSSDFLTELQKDAKGGKK